MSLSKKSDVKPGHYAEFPISWLRCEGTQARDGLDPATVERYAADMEQGDEFPAIDAFWDGSAAWIGNGHHRWWAAKRAKRKTVSVFIREGGQRDAILFGVGANGGKVRTDKDKRKAVSLLLCDPEWTVWSDREIARRCHVGATLVGEVRAQLSANGQLPDVTKRKSKDGKVRDVAAIGAANKAKAKGEANRAAANAGTLTPDSPPARPRVSREGADELPESDEPTYDVGEADDGGDDETSVEVVAATTARPEPVMGPGDAAGREFPAKAHGAWRLWSEIAVLATDARKLKLALNRLDERTAGTPFETLLAAQGREVRAVESYLEGMEPYVCPFCKGTYDDCPECHGAGWMPRAKYEAAPEELRETEQLAGDIGHWLGKYEHHNDACRSA